MRLSLLDRAHRLPSFSKESALCCNVPPRPHTTPTSIGYTKYESSKSSSIHIGLALCCRYNPTQPPFHPTALSRAIYALPPPNTESEPVLSTTLPALPCRQDTMLLRRCDPPSRQKMMPSPVHGHPPVNAQQVIRPSAVLCRQRLRLRNDMTHMYSPSALPDTKGSYAERK